MALNSGGLPALCTAAAGTGRGGFSARRYVAWVTAGRGWARASWEPDCSSGGPSCKVITADGEEGEDEKSVRGRGSGGTVILSPAKVGSLRRPRGLALLALAAALGLLFGCTSPEHKAERAARDARSWEATLRLTAQAFERGAVPRVYARQVLDAGMESRQRQSAQPEWNALPPDARAGLNQAVHRLASSIGDAPADSAR